MPSLRSNILCALSFGAAALLSPATARAHFVLDAPGSWSVDNMGSGAPEKLGPCGNEGTPVPAKDDAGQPLVTAFQEGQMISVTITEVIFHPGHYRISLSLDWADAGDTVQSGFPADPMVMQGRTNSGSMVCPGAVVSTCGSVPIVAQTPSATPQGWILADNVFEHCQAFSGPQTIKVALPPGVTCKECVLQVLEFMSDHGLNPQGGCFYHHCANISIQGGGNMSSDASTDATSSADASSSGSMSSGSVSSGTFVSSGSASGVSSGSTATSGTNVSSGSATSGTASSSGSSTSSGSASPASGSAPGATASNSSGCAVSPRGAASAMTLAWLSLAASTILIRRGRRGRRSAN